MNQKIARYSMKRTRRRRPRRKTRGGHRQYLTNVGYLNGYVPSFDRTMTTPSANRTAFNWA